MTNLNGTTRLALGCGLELDHKLSGCSGVALKETTDLPVGLGSVRRFPGSLKASTQTLETVDDALAEAFVHRLLFLLAIAGTAQNEDLVTARARAVLDLQSFAN